MELDKLKSLLELCKSFGVYHFKSESVEFSITPSSYDLGPEVNLNDDLTEE